MVERIHNKQFLYSTFWGGTKKDTALAVALGPGESATVVGEVYSEDLPVARAAQEKIGSGNDAYVAQFCDPWLATVGGDGGVAKFTYTIGGEKPAGLDMHVMSGCTVKFDAVGPEFDATWLAVANDGGTVPMKLSLNVNTDGLEPGDYFATIKVTVDAAFYKTLSIPVELSVVAQPPIE